MRKRQHNPLARQIVDSLRQEWRHRGRPGVRLPAEAALARRFGVSNVTVREALAVLAGEGLIERRHGCGTFLADVRKTRAVGLFSNMDLTHPRVGPYYRTLAYELRNQFADAGMFSHLYLGRNGPGSEAEAIACPELFQALAAHQLAGLIVLTCPTVPTQTQTVFGTLEIPVVGRGLGFEHAHNLPFERMIVAGLRDLVERGCRRIAFLGWLAPRQPQEFPLVKVLADERAYLEQHGVEVRRDWIRGDLYPTLSGAGWEEFREIWMAAADQPDGLLICDDCLLSDVGLALAQLGVTVPRDLAVAAITNRGVSPAFPFPLTRIESDPAESAREMAEMLMALMAGESRAAAERLGTFTVIPPARQATATVAARESAPAGVAGTGLA